MARDNSSGKLSKKKVVKKVATKVKVVKSVYPKVLRDEENNFLSIKLKAGVEAKSYLKKGILFSENEDGEVIEIQVVGDLVEIGEE